MGGGWRGSEGLGSAVGGGWRGSEGLGSAVGGGWREIEVRVKSNVPRYC